MRIGRAQAERLHRLSLGESVRKSQLPKSLLEALTRGNVVRLEKSGSSYVVRGIPGKIENFVRLTWGIRDLEGFANSPTKDLTRTHLAQVADDSKALNTRPLDGIFIRSFGNCFFEEHPLSYTPPGTSLLIRTSELEHLRIQSECLIAVENVECLWQFEKTYKYFPQLAGLDFTILLRWHWGVAWRRWLKCWKGQMLYLPDFDPAGLRIFATEVLRFKSDAQLLVPKDFELVLQDRGRRDLYLKNEHCFPPLDSHPEIARVGRCLKAARKAFEQEMLLS